MQSNYVTEPDRIGRLLRQAWVVRYLFGHGAGDRVLVTRITVDKFPLAPDLYRQHGDTAWPLQIASSNTSPTHLLCLRKSTSRMESQVNNVLPLITMIIQIDSRLSGQVINVDSN